MINPETIGDFKFANHGVHRQPAVQVRASYMLRVPPDRFRLLVCVTSAKLTCAEAKSSVVRRVLYIEQILTTQRIQDVTTFCYLRREENGFRMTKELVINFSDLSKCLEIFNTFNEKLDTGVIITGPEFDHSSTVIELARKEVSVQAAKIAREKAQQLAAVFSTNLGKLVSVCEEKCSESTRKENYGQPSTSSTIQSQIDDWSITLHCEVVARFSLAVAFDKMLTNYRWL